MLLSIGTILKSHTPISLYSMFNVSRRKAKLVIAPIQDNSFVFKASTLWNTFQTLPEGREIKDFSVGIGFLKNKIKSLIKRRQNLGDDQEWHPQTNFNITDN